MSRPFRSRLAQRGMSLAVVLILLVVLTLLALAGIRGTLLEQYMSTSQMDRGWSFQTTEAALREGEAAAALKPAAPAIGTCTAGVCARPAAGLQRWLDTDANWTSMSVPATTDLGTGAATPRYIIEVMAVDAIPGANCVTEGDVSPDAACTSRESRYRVTARSFAAAGDRAEVILQSNLAVP
jgi:type IV pilus assembly protein PilX